MGAPLLIAAAAAQVAQGVMAYTQSRSAAKAEARRQSYNEAIIKQNNSIERSRLQREQRKELATSIVQGSASGAGLSNFGEVITDQAEDQALDVALMNYNSNLEVQNSRYESKVKQAQIKTAGKGKLIGSFINAASTASPAGIGSGATESVASGMNQAGFGTEAYSMLEYSDKARGYY